MLTKTILTCALGLSSFGWKGHTRIEGTKILAQSEEQRLRNWIHKNNPGCEIFITPKGQAEKLKEYGWEKVPFMWRGNEIWIQRKPAEDKRAHAQISASS